MTRSKLPVHQFKGTPARAGAAYGEAFAPQIMGFCRQETTPTTKRLAYAAKCFKHVEKSAPASAKLMKGIARGANLDIKHITLLTLHEEIVHNPHCTAFAATGAATRDNNTIVAMNWDWNSNLYPWPHLLKLDVAGSPRVATYAYPGLWAGAGVNEHGVAFMWTGSGYSPRIKPVVGVPTYVIIAEILRRKTVPAVLKYLSAIKNAGAFIFFLGDAAGHTAIVEGMPGRIDVVQGASTLSRANHYECADMAKCAKQRVPHKDPNWTSTYRTTRMAELMQKYKGRIDERSSKKILTDRDGAWPWIHQYPGGPAAKELAGMTMDSLFALCQDRVLWTARGGRQAGPWQSISV